MKLLSERRTGKDTAFVALISLVVSIFLVAFFAIGNSSTMQQIDQMVLGAKDMLSSINIWVVLILFVITFLLFFLTFPYRKKIGEQVYRWRYVIGIIILAICVIFELSGSSIAMWKHYLPNDTNTDSVVFGIERTIRSDEWAVQTPMAFSQYFNQSGPFPYFSDTIRGAATDTFIVYSQPVWTWAEIFRPFHWGYLALGPAKGLSFFWYGRLIALFLVSLEFGMFITKQRKGLSVAYAALVAFAPTVQWWFAICGFVEMLIFGQLAILIVYHYMRTQKYRYRILLMLGLVICGGAYILTFYPSWQIPFGYIFLAVLIGIILANRKKFCFNWKKDIPIWFLFIVLLGGSMAAIFLKSHDVISASMNTVYPGSRQLTGGGEGISAFTSLLNLFFPFWNENLIKNTCEASAFIDFAPIGFLLGLWVIFKQKKRDPYLISFMISDIFLFAYCALPWPEILSKITLLSFCQPERVIVPLGFINLLVLFRALTLFKAKFSYLLSIIISIFTGIIIAFLCNIDEPVYATKMRLIVICCVVAIFTFIILQICRKWAKSIFPLLCIGMVLFAGGLVNPINKGLSVVYDNPLTQEIYNITHEDQGTGKWIVDSAFFPIINLPIMVGAPTINSTNVYPNIDRWELLDPKGEYNDIYNRYAHIGIELTNTEDSTFKSNESPDLFQLDLNVNDMEKLEVKHILSNRDMLESLSNSSVTIQMVSQIQGYYIYDVTYA
ncbi:DUF7657 domain-containing protein [Massilioclostridium coli]|uniref:DUF7657 domain-containing protein n=1 Tax=Massilioclostridium coli TaxID=1870991 RepID=UPI00085C0810|nr:hypothetical protein [Massilioclostridium coli]